jgi:hypothetical protein
MPELERALVALGRNVDYPATPDLGGAVRARLAEGRAPRFAWLQRRVVAVALAALLFAAGALMAVPQSRSAILDWLGIGSVTVRYVDQLPEVERRTSDLGLGERVSLEEARDRVPFGIRVPTLSGLGDPDVYYRGRIGQVSLLYGSEDDPKLLITQVTAPNSIEKLLAEGTRVDHVRVADGRGVWLEGGEHVLFYPDGIEPLRLVGNALVFERADGVTVRIEADVARAEALRIARSMR